MNTIKEQSDGEYGLKVCNACGSLNHLEQACCANCEWQGNFDYNPERIFGILAEIQCYLNDVLEGKLSESLPWRKTLSVQIKSLVFRVHKPSEVE
jgi:hypothetical protein